MIEIDAMFPVMVTANLEAVKAFYESVFGFNAVFYDADFYLHLVSPNSGVQLGFLMPEHASQPDFLRPLMSPDGYVISLEVKDAAHAYAEAQKMDLTMAMDGVCQGSCRVDPLFMPLPSALPQAFQG